MADAYQSDVSIDGIGFEPTQAHLQEATDKFLAEATEANPNGIQGNPELLGHSFVVGGSAVYRFRIGLVAPVSGVSNGDSAGNRSRKPSGNQPDSGSTNGAS